MAELREKRAIVLLSGGLDSVVSLAKARQEMEVRLALFFDYGQRALERERAAASEVASHYGTPLLECDIRWLGPLAPVGMREGISGESEEARLDTLEAVWVPNRNGVFLNIAAAYAENLSCDAIVAGFNREEALEFPDNSRAYVNRVNACLRLSTRNGVQVVTFTQSMTKRGILLLGSELKAPLWAIWSCYGGGLRMCGSCASCRKLRSALDSLPKGKRPPLAFEA